MKESHPPKWADRFLAWYCDPDLLEEIKVEHRRLLKAKKAKTKRAEEKAAKAFAQRLRGLAAEAAENLRLLEASTPGLEHPPSR